MPSVDSIVRVFLNIGETPSNLQKIFHDLKQSWYFRIWSLLWIVCALAVCFCFVILSAQSDKSAKQKDRVIWTEYTDSLNFPKFHFRTTGGPSENILSVSCQHGTQNVPTGPCAHTSNLTVCVAVSGDQFIATNDRNASRQDGRISCTVTTSFGADQSLMLAWSLDGTKELHLGGTSFSPLWMTPNNNIHILLEKSVETGSSSTDLWHRSMSYHNSTSQNGVFVISTIIDSFRVIHFDEKDTYTGWMGTADIGGFTFFLVILHSLAMLAIGFFMTNDSHFLKKGCVTPPDGKKRSPDTYDAFLDG